MARLYVICKQVRKVSQPHHEVARAKMGIDVDNAEPSMPLSKQRESVW